MKRVLKNYEASASWLSRDGFRLEMGTAAAISKIRLGVGHLTHTSFYTCSISARISEFIHVFPFYLKSAFILGLDTYTRFVDFFFLW